MAGTGTTPEQTADASAPDSSGTPGPTDHKASPTVRFESKVEEIDPIEPLQGASQSQTDGSGQTEVTPEQIKDLAMSLKTTHLQGLRIANFAYEPVSLPASRTGSHEDDSHHTSRQHTSSSAGGSSSPRLHARIPGVQSPPLTPSGTSHIEADAKSPMISAETGGASSPRHGVITPQESTGQETTAPTSTATSANKQPSSSDEAAQRPATAPEGHEQHLGDHRKGLFSVGPTTSGGGSGTSQPVSRESSPASAERTASQFYSRPITPAGDANDPYAAHKRTAPNKIEPRFMFSRFSRKKDISPTSSSVSVHKSKDEKRHSSFFGSSHHHKTDNATPHSTHHDGSSSPTTSSRQGSMSDLKRFFKLGPSHHHKVKRAVSPAASIRSRQGVVRTSSSVQIPFGDEHTLTSKYGKLGKVLGAGAGGSVRLMKRSEDNTVFAVKEFRARHTYETEKEYVKKLTAEYCIGSSLHHGNIIETLDIIREKTKWYEVMEYAPFDLFAIVMTGKMSKPEISCCFLQILSGVTYLHSMGLAHRDLKLDNVVVSGDGIMKIIDFGSAHVFKYPFENGIVMATGIVGSDPYLAPEVYDERKYDPTAVDIWSLAIIYCCMTLRRFPWKVPRLTDNSFKLFAAEPTPGHDPKKLMLSRHKSPESHRKSEEVTEKPHEKTEVKTGAKVEDKKDDKEAAADSKPADKPSDNSTDKPVEKSAEKPSEKPAEKREVIKGPWRILRLLPRESRHAIGGMLEIDPKERMKMSELLKDPWVANTVICRQIGPGKVEKAEGHTHILEPPAQPMKS